MEADSNERRFVILSLPRTGSTALARLLNTHPDIRCIIEPFHPRRYEGKFHELASGRSLGAALDLIWTKWNAIKHVYEAGGWPFVDRPEMNDRIAQAHHRVIFLMRRNLLRRVVSNLICLRTQFWIGTREHFRERLENATLPALNPEAVWRQMQADRQSMVARLEWLRAHCVEAMPLYYEDVFRDDSGAIERLELMNRLLAFLGFSGMTMETFAAECQRFYDPDVYKWASAEVYRLIPGIDRIEETLGCAETGWLFQ